MFHANVSRNVSRRDKTACCAAGLGSRDAISRGLGESCAVLALARSPQNVTQTEDFADTNGTLARWIRKPLRGEMHASDHQYSAIARPGPPWQSRIFMGAKRK